MAKIIIYNGDNRLILKDLPSDSAQCCVTSPPYWGLRDYGTPGQIGLESTIEEFVAKMVEVFREVRRVLRRDGVLFLNLGDSYSAHPGQRKSTDAAGPKQMSKKGSTDTPSRNAPGLKPKDLCGIPWRVALALQADGWYLRSEITWCKTSPMPESVTDRPTSATEKIFMLTKSAKYFYDAVAVREPFADKRNGNPGTKGLRKYAPGDRQDVGRPMAWEKGAERGGRNSWNYWILGPEPFKGAHFAVFPTELVRRCIAAGSKEGDMVLDPFSGAGTTGLVAAKMERDAALIELNPEYCEMSRLRINKALGMLAEVVNG